jgi:hypothetical protein
MKKIILLLALLMNLMPTIQNGILKFSSQEALGQSYFVEMVGSQYVCEDYSAGQQVFVLQDDECTYSDVPEVCACYYCGKQIECGSEICHDCLTALTLTGSAVDPNASGVTDGTTSSGGGGGGGSSTSNILPNVKVTYSASLYSLTGGYLKGVSNCKNVADAIMRQILGSNANIGSSANEMQLWKEVNGELTKVGNANSIFNEINRHLAAGHPIEVGVDHDPGCPPGQHDGTTDHFVVITGRGYDTTKGQYYYNYVETGCGASNSSQATSDDNRLYYNTSTGTFTDYPAGAHNDLNYTLTHIRPNM